MIVLFPLKENAFSYHCEVNKNNFGLEKLERELSVNISCTVLRVSKVRGKSSGAGVKEAIYMSSPF